MGVSRGLLDLAIEHPHHCLSSTTRHASSTKFFIAGDVRCNEHAVLLSMHTLFLREHNRLCERIALTYPTKYKSDEDIYQAARKVVGAQMQVITYEEFLPAILGKNVIPGYSCYDETVNAGIANEFSTAFYRLGHSMLSDNITLNNGDSVPLRNLFFNPSHVEDHGIEAFLGRLHTSTMQSIDTHVVDSVRNFLFNPPFASESHHFLDLVCLNIQRGRDHGLPGYNVCRTAYGLSPYKDFSEISSNQEVVDGLKSVYANVDEIDPWVGALAEDTIAGAAVGELTRAALADQFTRLRDGDRHWWLNDDSHILKQWNNEIALTTLGKILTRNTTGVAFPDDVFHVR